VTAVGPDEAPEGATPLDDDDAEGLLPSHISTKGDLNEWEHLNISAALSWALPSRRRQPEEVLSVSFAEELHRRMFDRTWKWAGTYRRMLTTPGSPPERVRVDLRERLADARYWHENNAFPPDDIAARLHHALVVVHPWPNGNGRWSRLMADAYLQSVGEPLFTWGGGDLVAASGLRGDYLRALRAADHGDFAPLLGFVRRV
jgi:Fic-DOC domain mobile mystery protein B